MSERLLVRGDSFEESCVYMPGDEPVALADDDTVEAFVRVKPGSPTLVSVLEVVRADQDDYPGEFKVRKGYTEVDGTHTWPLGTIVFDVRITRADGYRKHSEIQELVVTESATR